MTLLSVFRDLSVNPWMNVALGLLFITFALSLFGMFEIVLPNFLVKFTSQREGVGSLGGTVFMALSFSIISFTCVAPFLGGVRRLRGLGQLFAARIISGRPDVRHGIRLAVLRVGPVPVAPQEAAEVGRLDGHG